MDGGGGGGAVGRAKPAAVAAGPPANTAFSGLCSGRAGGRRAGGVCSRGNPNGNEVGKRMRNPRTWVLP